MNLKARNIVFVAGLHGNERMPVRALKARRIPFILGNPVAYKKDVRYTAHDLNASFGVRRTGYEARRAAAILKEIPSDALVVDFHTTTAVTPPFIIVTDRKMLSFAATAGIPRVVLMKHNIKRGHALINHRDGISVEAGRHGTRASRETTLRVARGVLARKSAPIRVYEVYDIIEKPGRYRNFRKHTDGFIPVLAGEASYSFPGLKARLIGTR